MSIISVEVTRVYSLIRPHRSDTPRCDLPTLGKTKVPKLQLSQIFDSDHLVILEFSARKLAFVFRDRTEADRFKLCMQILIRYVRNNNNSVIVFFVCLLHECSLFRSVEINILFALLLFAPLLHFAPLLPFLTVQRYIVDS